MKQIKILLFVPLLLGATTMVRAQGSCSKNHPVYNVDASGTPKKIFNLGADPEFPFLRNLSTSEQVVKALNSPANRKKYPRKMNELDDMLKEIGFAGGAMDVTTADVSSYTIPAGTTGNMGNGKMNYAYTETGKPMKAWKISSTTCPGYISFMYKCGNAFYSAVPKPRCENMAVSVASETKEITVEPQEVIKKKTYVYFKRCGGCSRCGERANTGCSRCGERRQEQPVVSDNPVSWTSAAYEAGKVSSPLLIKTDKESLPVTYKVSASGTGTVCNGENNHVNADINVERQGEYAGYNPDNIQKEYIEVSRHDYEMLARGKAALKDLLENGGQARSNSHEGYKCHSCK